MKTKGSNERKSRQIQGSNGKKGGGEMHRKFREMKNNEKRESQQIKFIERKPKR